MVVVGVVVVDATQVHLLISHSACLKALLQFWDEEKDSEWFQQHPVMKVPGKFTNMKVYLSKTDSKFLTGFTLGLGGFGKGTQIGQDNSTTCFRRWS